MESSAVFSHEICENAVKKRLDDDQVKIVDFEILPWNSGNFIVKITVNHEDDEKTLHFFAKPNSMVPKINNIFYRDFKRTIPKFDPRTITPEFYYGNAHMIFLDDLTTHHFQRYIFGEYLDLKHARVVLSVLAKIHSVSFAYEDIKGGNMGRPCRLDEEYSLTHTNVCLKDENVLKILSKILNESTEDAKAAIVRNLESRQTTKKYSKTLCHSDLVQKNILFYYNYGFPDDCRLINFKACQYASPLNDVLQMLFFNLSDDQRPLHLQDLLSYYHDRLREDLKQYCLDVDKILPKEDLQAGFHHFLPLIKLEVVLWKQKSQIPLDKDLQELKDILVSC